MPLMTNARTPILGLIITAATVLAAWFVFGPAPAQANPAHTLPPEAQEVAPDVFHLGARFEDGVRIDGYAFVRRALPAKPEGTPGGGNGKDKGGGGTTTSSCFAYIANGAAWAGSEPLVVDLTGRPSTITDADLTSAVADGVLQWNAATLNDVFGAQSTGTADIATMGQSTNGRNEVAFVPIAQTGVIGITYVWGIFQGPPRSRGLVEWDMVLDADGDFEWQVVTTIPNLTDGIYVVDIDSIITHELGHSLGLSHPADECTDETMYRYYGEGQTHQRDLAAGDIAGAQSLYGEA